MAERAGLMGKNNWKRHPRQMLEARATAELCRLIFADVTHGLPSVEEVEDGGLYDESPADPSSPAPADTSSGKVSRRPRKGTSKPAGGPAPTTPPVVSGSVPSAPRPPLPGVRSPEESAGDPGEGTSTSSTPADPGPYGLDNDGKPATEPRASSCELGGAEGAHEPHDFKSGRFTYRCPGYDVRPCHIEGDHGARLEDGTPAGHFWSADYARHWCTGLGSAEPVECPATGTDEQYAEMQEAAADVVDAEVVDESPEGIHPGQKRAVEAALGSLGVKYRSERHHVASAILGRRITTFGAAKFDAEGTLEGLTADDGSRLLNALARVKDRNELEAMIQRAAEEWEAGRDG